MVYNSNVRQAPDAEVGKRAQGAVVCFYHPDTDRSVLKSKKDWADEWDVEKMRFDYWENTLRSDGMLVSVERGAILLPLRDLPDGSKKGYAKAAATEGGTTLKCVQVAVHGYNLEELKAQLEKGCHRVGDDVQYGSHGLTGMYREGIKWAAAEVVAGRLPWSGHKAAEVLKAVGLHVSGDPPGIQAKRLASLALFWCERTSESASSWVRVLRWCTSRRYLGRLE